MAGAVLHNAKTGRVMFGPTTGRKMHTPASPNDCNCCIFCNCPELGTDHCGPCGANTAAVMSFGLSDVICAGASVCSPPPCDPTCRLVETIDLDELVYRATKIDADTWRFQVFARVSGGGGGEEIHFFDGTEASGTLDCELLETANNSIAGDLCSSPRRAGDGGTFQKSTSLIPSGTSCSFCSMGITPSQMSITTAGIGPFEAGICKKCSGNDYRWTGTTELNRTITIEQTAACVWEDSVAANFQLHRYTKGAVKVSGDFGVVIVQSGECTWTNEADSGVDAIKIETYAEADCSDDPVVTFHDLDVTLIHSTAGVSASATVDGAEIFSGQLSGKHCCLNMTINNDVNCPSPNCPDGSFSIGSLFGGGQANVGACIPCDECGDCTPCDDGDFPIKCVGRSDCCTPRLIRVTISGVTASSPCTEECDTSNSCMNQLNGTFILEKFAPCSWRFQKSLGFGACAVKIGTTNNPCTSNCDDQLAHDNIIIITLGRDNDFGIDDDDGWILAVFIVRISCSISQDHRWCPINMTGSCQDAVWKNSQGVFIAADPELPKCEPPPGPHVYEPFCCNATSITPDVHQSSFQQGDVTITLESCPDV